MWENQAFSTASLVWAFDSQLSREDCRTEYGSNDLQRPAHRDNRPSGSYALGAVSEDQWVARRAVLDTSPDAAIMILDATNLAETST